MSDWGADDEAKHPRDDAGRFTEKGDWASRISDTISRQRASLAVREYEGVEGNRNHITRIEQGMVPVDWVRGMLGVRGERPGEHRNRRGVEWEQFKDALQAGGEGGIHAPLLITVDPGSEPKLSEGNHRRDAYVELGAASVPVEIRYYGHAEREGTVGERAGAAEAWAGDDTDYYHGTAMTESDIDEIMEGDEGALIQPARSTGRVIHSSMTDPEFAYVTTSVSDAWYYAELAATHHMGRPRVFRVRATGPVEEDPFYDAQGRSRGIMSDDRRSRHPFEIQEELPFPGAWGDPEDWDS